MQLISRRKNLPGEGKGDSILPERIRGNPGSGAFRKKREYPHLRGSEILFSKGRLCPGGEERFHFRWKNLNEKIMPTKKGGRKIAPRQKQLFPLLSYIYGEKGLYVLVGEVEAVSFLDRKHSLFFCKPIRNLRQLERKKDSEKTVRRKGL